MEEPRSQNAGAADDARPLPPDSVGSVTAGAAEAIGVAREYLEAPRRWPDSARVGERVGFGFALIYDALALLKRERELAKRAIVPALLFAAICVTVALAGEEGPDAVQGPWPIRVYGALIAAAPISPIFFTKTYARLAADARRIAGYPSRAPYLRSYLEATWETLVQLTVLAAFIAPWVALLDLVPVAGRALAALITAAWAVHWVVVEALDSSRTLDEDGSPPAIPRIHTTPWFGRLPSKDGPFRLFRAPLGPVAGWGRLLSRTVRRWRGELEFVEQHPWISIGFGAGAALLLALPLVNLFFRPVVVVAAAIWRAEAERASTVG